MQSNAPTLPSAAFISALGLERLDREVRSAYWLRFLNGRWLIYWHERLIGDFPAENAAMALRFLRLKQSEPPVHGWE
jgi:hypothetical protein